MKRTSIRYLLLAFLLTLAVSANCGAVFAEDTLSVNVPVTYGQTEARSMLSMINEFRTGEDAWEWNEDNATKTTHTDLKALSYDYDLEKVAMQRAAEIAISFSHTRPNGGTCYTAYSDLGVSCTAAAENIAAGYGTAAAVFAGWQETDEAYSDQGHRRNMLSSDVTAIGIGHVVYNGVHYWVQEFRSPAGSAAATAAKDSETEVSVEILKSNISNSSVQADVSTLSVSCGDSVDLPALTSKITTAKTWPSGRLTPVILPYEWTSASSQIASISNGKITGNQAGTTSITASVSLDEEKTVTIPVTVLASVSGAEIQLSQASCAYDGTAKEPAVQSVTVNGTALTQGTDYTVSYKNNVSVGTGTVVITGIGNYTGTAQKTFTITPKSISGVTVSGLSDKTYTGSAQTASVTVKDGSTTLTQGTDYTVSYSDNINAGTATVTLKGSGNYTGTLTKTFTIAPKSISGVTISGLSDKTYTGSAQTAAVTVKDGSTTLTQGTDYTVSYSNNINAGTAAVTLKGMGNYTGTLTKTFAIAPKSISGVTVSGLSNKTYTGSSQTASITIKDGSAVLTEGTDYTVSYSNNINAGTGAISIMGKGNYTDTLTKNFVIAPKSIQGLNVTGLSEQTYTGGALTPAVTVTDSDTVLVKDKDYTVSYSNNINVGTGAVTITGKGNYTGTAEKTFSIAAKSISGVTVSGIEDMVYTGQALTQTFTVTDGTSALKEDTDYTVSYSDNVEMGKATVTITGTGNYTDYIVKSFAIGKDLKDCVITGLQNYTYTGGEIRQELSVDDGDIRLTEGTDYSVSYSNNINAGTASMTISGKGSYVGSVSKTFTIAKKNQTISAKSYTKTYGDKAFSLGAKAAGTLSYKSSNTSVATVSSAGKVTIKGTGKAVITITAKNANYNTPAKQITITVKPKKVSGIKVKAGKKQMTVTWKKDAKATGYQLTYALNSKFTKSKKNVTISKNKTTKKVIKKLKSGKTYYVKVRAYKKAGSAKLYGSYSAVKKVKVK
ncbi:CAP domain-containing protein [bacterium 210820-DFI.6.37]|nr:CAP domain-containing protein [bacterium 210820-DFI.6.37]